MENIFKIGQKVKYTIPDNCSFKSVAGKIFVAEIILVDMDAREYGVYAEYGQDFVSFDKCELAEDGKH